MSRAVVRNPEFSLAWFVYRRSWYSQYLPASAAQSAADAARNDSGPRDSEVPRHEANLLGRDELLDRSSLSSKNARHDGHWKSPYSSTSHTPTDHPRSRCRSGRSTCFGLTTVTFAAFDRELCTTMPITAATTTTAITIQKTGGGPVRRLLLLGHGYEISSGAAPCVNMSSRHSGLRGPSRRRLAREEQENPSRSNSDT